MRVEPSRTILQLSLIASERTNSTNARALAALGDRLLTVEQGLHDPAPAIVREVLPKLASAVDGLFAEVRSSIDKPSSGMFDPVTSLPNRLHFRAEADKLIAASGRHAIGDAVRRPGSLQRVNDSLGHARGDQLLLMSPTAARGGEYRSRGRRVPAAIASPFGGDEFTIFISPTSSPDDAERVGRRIAQAISEPFELHGHSIEIGASVGVALSPTTARTSKR
jgi:diguanylate cyclase (GGDEF)-like protein